MLEVSKDACNDVEKHDQFLVEGDSQYVFNFYDTVADFSSTKCAIDVNGWPTYWNRRSYFSSLSNANL